MHQQLHPSTQKYKNTTHGKKHPIPQPTHMKQSPHHPSHHISTTNPINLYHTYAITLMGHSNP
jgi:ribonuclease HI